MPSLPAPPAKLLDELRASKDTRVKVAVSDVDGILRGKYMDKAKFLSAAESGFGFCNVVFGWDAGDVCYDNATYTGWHSGYPDDTARVDLATMRRVPWENDVPFFLADFANDVCPRTLLKRTVDRARGMGFAPVFGMEFEWFNFRETPQSLAAKGYRRPEPITPGMFGYSILRAGQNEPFFAAIMDEMARYGIPIEGLHTETGPGVLEVALGPADALEAADRALLFKTGVKHIAQRFGIMPSFMAKWDQKLPGCSGHVHQSLSDIAGKKNLFHEEGDPHKMSATYKSYLAGQMRCLPEILPMFAPTINSYKRLVDGYWAPTKVTWGIDNRTTAFRAIPASPKATRLETRVPGSDVHPHLAIAACLASGLYGIEKKLELHERPIEGSAYLDKHSERLPRNLQEATARMKDSKLARELFGQGFVDHFVATREWEWRQYQDAVTDWETQRYFEII
ncbi:MAG TPA: glutamine synthetase family protein [Candidatus Thermoplasmatota archaeon]|nr:glutamine synthetase family protein [Candidatus Thermoplasmatota archaeon]